MAASEYARTSGTYASLRAQATTKADVDLGNVGNYGISSSITSTSTTTYANSAAARLASLSTAGNVTTHNAVGAYCFCKYQSSAALDPGATVAGSSLRPANAAGNYYSSALSGTWRCMGYKPGNSEVNNITLYVRIS